MAHQRADAARAVLSAVKINVALLPDHTTRELWPSGLSVDIMLRFRSPYKPVQLLAPTMVSENRCKRCHLGLTLGPIKSLVLHEI